MIRSVAVTFLLASAGSAQVNLLQNGSFESGPSIPTGQTEKTLVGAQLPGWVIPFGNVDYNSPFWSPSDGLRSIDLHGIAPGAIEQAVTTVPGAAYQLVFDLGAAGTTAMVQVTAAGSISPTFTHTDSGFPTVSYAGDQTWSFVTTGSTTTIRFDSLTAGGANGPHLDNVRLFGPQAVASAMPFGRGCVGTSGRATLKPAPGSLPRLGTTFTLDAGGLPTSPLRPSFLFLGSSRSDWGGVRLPLSLDNLAAPGCSVYVSLEFQFFLSPVAGQASFDISVPADPALIGAGFFSQVLIFDITANGLGLVFSNGVAAGIGV